MQAAEAQQSGEGGAAQEREAQAEAAKARRSPPTRRPTLINKASRAMATAASSAILTSARSAQRTAFAARSALRSFTADPAGDRRLRPTRGRGRTRCSRFEELAPGEGSLRRRSFTDVGDREAARASGEHQALRAARPAARAGGAGRVLPCRSHRSRRSCRSKPGTTLGTVVAVRNFGAGDLLEVRPGRGRQDSNCCRSTKATVPSVDIASGTDRRGGAGRPIFPRTQGTGRAEET